MWSRGFAASDGVGGFGGRGGKLATPNASRQRVLEEQARQHLRWPGDSANPYALLRLFLGCSLK